MLSPLTSRSRSFPALVAVAFALGAAGLGGCHRYSSARVYTVQAEPEATPNPVGAAARPPMSNPGASASDSSIPKMERPRARVTYETPAGWLPSEGSAMTVVNFTVAGAAEGEGASVNVTPLGNFAGREAMLVNMWRNQVGSEPLSPEEAARTLSDVAVAGEIGKIFEVSGSRDGKTRRLVTAMLTRDDGTWFFKLAGDEPVVQAQRPAFLNFLKSFRFVPPDAAPAAPASTSSSPAASAAPATTAPAPVPAAAPAPKVE